MRFRKRMLFLAAAAALGIVADLFAMGDAYEYSARMQQTHVAAFVAALIALFLGTAVLNFGAQRTFAVAAMVWAGMMAAHTWVLIWETSRDPTSHNLWPFEYFFMSFLVILALMGAVAGRLAGAARAPRAQNKI
jgi:hypothetical protein